MRSDTVYKQAFNRTLDLLGLLAIGQPLPSENTLRRDLQVSRTTVRKVLAELKQRGILTANIPAGNSLARPPTTTDPYAEAETTTRTRHVEAQFMEWMLRVDTRPGTLINELDLARQFSVATSGIREFLIRFSRFGLIEKKPNSGWLFHGFTEPFALDLFEIRVLFELRAALRFAELPDTSPLWADLEQLRDEHLALQSDIAARFHDFSSLDNRFHLLVHRAAPNRFVDDFNVIITLIFHYHYQWNKTNEQERNAAAIAEHLACIAALLNRDAAEIDASFRAHLSSARSTLIRSLIDNPVPAQNSAYSHQRATKGR